MPDNFEEKKSELLEKLRYFIETTGKRNTTRAMSHDNRGLADSVDHVLRNQILIMEVLEFLVEDKI